MGPWVGGIDRPGPSAPHAYRGTVGPIPDPEGPADVSQNLFVDIGPVDFIPYPIKMMLKLTFHV